MVLLERAKKSVGKAIHLESNTSDAAISGILLSVSDNGELEIKCMENAVIIFKQIAYVDIRSVFSFFVLDDSYLNMNWF